MYTLYLCTHNNLIEDHRNYTYLFNNIVLRLFLNSIISSSIRLEIKE